MSKKRGCDFSRSCMNDFPSSQTAICSVTGTPFAVSAHEMTLRAKFGFGESLPSMAPKYRFRLLGAFWPMWNLYQRKCDRTGKAIVSIFRPDCRHPVWQRDEWITHADPPYQDFDFQRPFFEQAKELFPRCPLPHNFQSHNENCEYTDDWYRSKNCYLSHSGQNNEDCRYCYGSDSIKHNLGTVFSFDSEWCTDLIHSQNCYDSVFLLNCKSVSSSAFLYDCRNCSDCLFCFNLRHKKYCFGNQQLTKEEFEARRKEWDLSSQRNYLRAQAYFAEMMRSVAWHRALQIDHCEDATGNFIHHCKDVENCYMLSYHEMCANTTFAGPHAKFALDALGTVGSESTYMCSLPVYSYDAKFCFSVNNCRFVEYCAYLQNCEHCFGCCGLFGKKYCILNKQYSKSEYEQYVGRIREQMQKDGEWGKFFPPSFAPNPSAESFSGYHFPLSPESNTEFWHASPIERESMKTAEIDGIPDSPLGLSQETVEWLVKQVFWDDVSQRPFRIERADIEYAERMRIPLPHSYYINRIQQNFAWMYFSGELRDATCAVSGQPITTNWPAEYDGRIVSETEYLKLVG